MKKYLHIGYAKSGSTWLQSNLFPVHPQLYHLGRSYGDRIDDDDVRLVLWSDLIEKPEFLYDRDRAAACFQQHFDDAADMRGILACGVSHELITNTLHGRVDLSDRARRVAGIFGRETEIIMVVRNQPSFVRSLYTGMIREGGVTRTFEEFLFYFYYDRDRSPFSTLFYDRVFELYADLFGREHVHVVPFEILSQQSPEAFAGRVCEALGVNPLGRIDGSRRNESPSPKALSLIRATNKKLRFYLGNDVFERPWGFTAAPLYPKQFGVEVPREITDNAKKYLTVYRVSDQTVADLEAQGGTITPMDIEMPSRYRELLGDAYAPHNARLSELTGLDLGAFGYPLPEAVRASA